MTDAIRTPGERFEGLPNFPFAGLASVSTARGTAVAHVIPDAGHFLMEDAGPQMAS